MNYTKEFKMQITELSKIGSSLKKISLFIMISTIINILILAGVIARLKYDSGNFSTDKLAALWIVGLGVISFILLFYFNTKAKRGTILFDELSDDLEWEYRKNVAKPERIPIEFRIQLKEFYEAKNQFFLGNSKAQIVYFILNLSLLISSIILLNC